MDHPRPQMLSTLRHLPPPLLCMSQPQSHSMLLLLPLDQVMAPHLLSQPLNMDHHPKLLLRHLVHHIDHNPKHLPRHQLPHMDHHPKLLLHHMVHHHPNLRLLMVPHHQNQHTDHHPRPLRQIMAHHLPRPLSTRHPHQLHMAPLNQPQLRQQQLPTSSTLVTHPSMSISSHQCTR